MTTDDLPDDAPPEVVDQIIAARAAQEWAAAELGQVRETRRELASVWERLGLVRVQDTFGIELEIALRPRGRS